uniref:NADH dehydrogenase [ubiquinone] 1 alpha subcomplex assembly factor 3 n=1 Tax=Setaria digitata TaxID=48799 RepID=A0A915PRC5_9BILA
MRYGLVSDDNDQGPRTSLSRLNDEMMECQQIGIGAISKYGFRLYDGQFLYGPIAIFPKAVLSWRVLTPDDINPESLRFFTMLEPKLDVLVVGPGDRQHEEAAMLFNMLNIEYRCVAAALYPPDDLLVTTNDHVRLMNMYAGPSIDSIDILGGSDTDDRLALVKKAMRKYLPEEEARRMDKLETSRFFLPERSDDKDGKKSGIK